MSRTLPGCLLAARVLAGLVILLVSGCARHWTVPCVCELESPPVMRGQSPYDQNEDLDPAFGSNRPTMPSARPQPPAAAIYEAQPIPDEPRLEAPPAMQNDLFESAERPMYRATTLLPPEDEKPAPNESLADVRIEGNATIPAATMMRYIKSRPGRPTTTDQVRDDVRALYNTKWFFSIEPVFRRDDKGLALIFRVTEKPILRSVEYRGNEKIKDHFLAGITGLKPLHAFSVATNREAARRIKEHYIDKGYMFAEVELLEGGNPEDRTVVFSIVEGPKVQVSTVKFRGNQDISSELLKLKLATKKRILWYFGGQYDPESIAEDIAAIKQYYHNIGYFDIQVQESVEFAADRSTVVITYEIAEGPRYKIREIRIEGNQIYSNEQLMGGLEIKEGQYFTAREVSKDVLKIQQQYGELGRLFAKVNTNTVFTQEPGVVDLVLSIDEDRPYKIGMINVHIRGQHSHTKETVALNQMLIAPGELADPEKIRRTKARFAGAATWEAAGPDGPSIDLKPVASPIYVARNPAKSDLTVRGADGYFGGERPLNPETLNLPEPVRRALRETDVTPASLREEHVPATVPDTTPAPEAKTIAPIPGTGHTFAPRSQLTPPVAFAAPPVTSRPVNSPPLAGSAAHLTALNAAIENAPVNAAANSRLVAAAEPIPHSRSVRETASVSPRELASTAVDSTAEESAAPLVYEQVDLVQTGVFYDPPDSFYDPVVVPWIRNSETVIRGQNFDNYNNPPNLMYNETPQGDLLGPQLPSPVVPPGYVDLDVYLSEARTGRFMVGAGVNSDSGVVGNIVLEEQNFDIMRFPTSFRDIADGYAFRGGGQQFRLEATPGSEVSRYLASWTDPYFLNTDYSLGLSGFYYQRFFRDWSEQRTGGRVNVGKLLTRELSFNTALRLENVDVSRPRLAPGLAPSVDEIVGTNFLGTGRFTLAHDTRDSAYMATEGSNISGSVEQAFGGYDFTKLELNASQYFTVYQRPDGQGKQILSFRGNLGWTTDDTPAFERFYAGGFQSFRGFEFRSVSPLEPGNLGTNGAAVGGFFQALGTAEYMLPVMANEAVRVVAFTDFGTVDEDVSLDKFRVSVGAGLRITIPQMGPVPIALDWAFPVVQEETDIRQIFSFYIGVTR